MLNDANVLNQLKDQFKPDQLREIMLRLRGVPEVWESLHHEGFLKSLIEQKDGFFWTPGEVADRSLFYQESLLEDSGLESSIEDDANLSSLVELARKAHKLAERLNSPPETIDLRELYASTPAWTKTLNCAWMHVENPIQVIDQLLDLQVPAINNSLLSILHANYSPSELQEMLQASGDQVTQLMPFLLRNGERALAMVLADRVQDDVENFKSGVEPTTIENYAYAQAIGGDFEGAQLSLSTAWANATETTAQVADRLAEVARLEGNLSVELEARRKAVDEASSQIRRASYARSLVEADRAFEAIQLLAGAQSLEEHIAHGMATLQQGMEENALEVLEQARTEAEQLGYSDPVWLTWLADGLKACGALSAAIALKSYLAKLQPHDPELELELARLSLQAGDPPSALVHAEIALALNPQSLAARTTLAQSYRSNQEPEMALGYFAQVVIDDECILPEYGECALEAGNAEIALEVATQLTEQDPEAVEAQLLLARSYHLMGEVEQARTAIERVLDLDPGQAKPWLLLAEMQADAGEIADAGESLGQAIQADPSCGAAYHARAQWLADQDRLHEAIEIGDRAIELSPNEPTWLIDHAALLTKVGDPANARQRLRDALAIQPKNWKGRLALISNYEESQQLNEAASWIEPLPEELEDAERLDIGRVLVKIGLNGDGEALTKGFELLKSAEPGPDDNADYLFWLGRANEAHKNYEIASDLFEEYLKTYGHITEHYTLDAVLAYSRVSLELGKPDQAIAFLEANREKYPASMDIANYLVDAHLMIQEEEMANAVAQAALSHNPASLDAYRLVSKTAEAVGDIRSAIDAEQEVIAQQPEISGHWARLAELYSKIKESAESRTHLAKAIWMERSNPEALKVLSELSDRLRLHDTGFRLSKRAASLAPDNPAYQHELAVAAENIGNFQIAQDAWMRIVDQDPENMHAIKRAADTSFRIGESEAALSLWLKAHSRDESDADVVLAIAEAYKQRGDPLASLEYYQQLLRLDSNDPKSLYSTARAYLNYGSQERALSLIERGRHQFPDHDGIQLLEIEFQLRFGDQQSAYQEISEKVAQQSDDAFSLSLAALGALMNGDRERAKVGLDEAMRVVQLPSASFPILFEVCAALSEWRLYASLLHGLTGTDQHKQRLALRAALRARDLNWLYTDVMNVHTNKPDRDMIEASLNEVSINNPDPESPASNALVEWQQAFEHPIQIDAIDLSGLSHDEAQEMVQGLVVGYLRSNRPAKALTLLEANPPSAIYAGYHALLTGVAAWKSEQGARAKDSANLASQYNSTEACSFYLMGKVAMDEQQLDEAISAFNAALAIWPTESTWHVELAQVYARNEHIEAALPHLQQAVEIDPLNTDTLIQLGRTYRAAGEMSQAEAIYARLLQEGPPSSQLWKEAGEVALANKNAAQASEWFERACSLAPSDAYSLMGSAKAAWLLGQPKMAADRAKSAYKLAPNEPAVLTGFAEILSNQGKSEKALQAYDRAIKISAGDPQIQLARSRLLLDLGQNTDAINDIQAVLDGDVEDPDAWALLAEAQEKAADLDQALTAINQALQEAPRSSGYRMIQGRIYRKAGQLDQALKVLRELEQDEPNHQGLQGELGQIFEARRESDAALEAYLRAVAQNPQDIESCMRAGVILKGLKSYEHAAEMFERVVAVKPNDAQALHQLAAVRALQLVHGGIETQVVTT